MQQRTVPLTRPLLKMLLFASMICVAVSPRAPAAALTVPPIGVDRITAADPPVLFVKAKKVRRARPAKRRQPKRRSSRHNFYDAQINDYRGRRFNGPPHRDLRREWCLDCFGGGQ